MEQCHWMCSLTVEVHWAGLAMLVYAKIFAQTRSPRKTLQVGRPHGRNSLGETTHHGYCATDLSKNLHTTLIILQGPFLTTKHFLPSLKQSSAGVIVNISSDLGSIGCEFRSIISMHVLTIISSDSKRWALSSIPNGKSSTQPANGNSC